VWVRSNNDRFRFVLHHQVSTTDVDYAATINGFTSANRQPFEPLRIDYATPEINQSAVRALASTG
jgi:hypothetical protein